MVSITIPSLYLPALPPLHDDTSYILLFPTESTMKKFCIRALGLLLARPESSGSSFTIRRRIRSSTKLSTWATDEIHYIILELPIRGN